MPGFLLEIWISGRCPLLCTARRLGARAGEGGPQILVIREGLMNLPLYLSERRAGVNAGIAELLKLLRLFVSSCILAEDWLIEDKFISLEGEDILFDPSGPSPKLVLRDSAAEGRFVPRFAQLCSELPANADLIAEKLIQADAEALMDKRALLSFLAAWEYEISACLRH
ncbi:MAG: hypothetical protein GX975_03185 [Clostridiales bacterium]|nr:hypothetical protein [Clostridiales bacterium]